MYVFMYTLCTFICIVYREVFTCQGQVFDQYTYTYTYSVYSRYIWAHCMQHHCPPPLTFALRTKQHQLMIMQQKLQARKLLHER